MRGRGRGGRLSILECSLGKFKDLVFTSNRNPLEEGHDLIKVLTGAHCYVLTDCERQRYKKVKLSHTDCCLY